MSVGRCVRFSGAWLLGSSFFGCTSSGSDVASAALEENRADARASQGDAGDESVTSGSSNTTLTPRDEVTTPRDAVTAAGSDGGGTRSSTDDEVDAAVTGSGSGLDTDKSEPHPTSTPSTASSFGYGEPTSTDGDGRECDDGNREAGDGCSPVGAVEPGYSCTDAPACEPGADPCRISVRATYRDFSADQPDFGLDTTPDCAIAEGAPLPTGIVADMLDQDGRPSFASPSWPSCVESTHSFAQWYRGGVQKVDTLALYDNGQGGYVNRFGANGAQLVLTQPTQDERPVPAATSPEGCTPGCTERVGDVLQCDNVCRPNHDSVLAASNVVRQRELQLEQLQANLEAETASANPDASVVAELTEQIEALTSEIATRNAQVASFQAEAAECDANCQTDFESRVATCVHDCKPCSADPRSYCTGGELVGYDGDPVFFPVDDITGETSDLSPADLPEQFGFVGWPREDLFFPGAPDHNFNFTSELQSSFRFEPERAIELTFIGDDDLWVFINGRLAVDLGGVHTPTAGSVTLDESAGSHFGLEANQLYPIAVFHAERRLSGSALLVTLPPAAAYSVCTKNP